MYKQIFKLILLLPLTLLSLTGHAQDYSMDVQESISLEVERLMEAHKIP